MGTLIGILIIIGIFAFSSYSTNQKVENKNPLDVDNSKMTRDICNGVSQSEIRRRYGNGYYDKNR
jgi:hypothetical protein